MITHTGFFGDSDHTFTLTDDMIAELERLTQVGIGMFYTRAIGMQFAVSDIAQTIRLGLIGGGMAPQQAAQLVETYATNRPLAETFPLALDILDARWNGVAADTDEDTPQ